MKPSNLSNPVEGKEETSPVSSPPALDDKTVDPVVSTASPEIDDVFEKPKDLNLGGTSPSSTSKVALHSDEALKEDGDSGDESDRDEDHPEVQALPLNVRRLVSLTDDTKLPTLTFRYFLLSFLFVTPGAFLAQMSYFRTTQAPYSVFFVQIASHYVGLWLARVLPDRVIRIPFTKYSFNMNPGPWSIKEHVLVTITAASGATSNMAFTPLTMGEIYYKQRVQPAAALAFMFAVVWNGMAFTSFCRTLLLYEPQNIWPQALMQTTLFEAFRKTRANSRVAQRQMRVFFLCLLGMILWQFLPEYVFPFLTSLAFLCWVAPSNPTANFLGSGLGGMGFLNLSLDWSNINWQGANILLTPWWTQVVLFTAFVVNTWVLVPSAYWGNLAIFKKGLMSNKLLLANGSVYPITALLTPTFQLNETAYAQYGPIYWGPQVLWNTFFDYAKIPSSISWVLLFGWKPLVRSWKRVRQSYKEGKLNKSRTINHQYNDRLNVLQRSYDEVPMWWYGLLFLTSVIMLVTVTACGQMWIPVWTVFVGLGSALISVLPLAWIFANSNYLVAVGVLHEMIYGLMVQGYNGTRYRHPCGPTTYATVASDPWYRAQIMLQDQKIGHYMHVPPRAVFFSQIFGTIIGIPINYGVIRWVLTAKYDYLAGIIPDPIHQWTGQRFQTANTVSVMYAVIGPTKFFSMQIFRPLPYSFIMGFGTPFIIYGLHRLFPRARFDLWNVTIFFAGMANFYGNISSGYISAFIGGFVAMFWAYRYRYNLWKRYSYMIAAAFDAGFNFSMLLVFLLFGAAKTIKMPNWWGNDATSVERCFSLPKT